MLPNPIRTAWSEGRAVLNGWLSMSNPFGAEIMSAQGYDAVTIDWQHGIVGYAEMIAMLQAMRASNVAPMVRVPWLDAQSVMRPLDAGALGIICPMVNTAEEARALVSYLRYPPVGIRSFGPSRAVFAHGDDYGVEADREVAAFAMIETPEGYANVESIAAIEGLDGLYIGPADLTLALTGRKYRTGFDRDEPEMLAAIDRILKVAHAAGVRAALHCGSPEYAARAVKWGFDLVTLPNDVRMLAAAARASVAQTRRLIDQP